MCEGKSGEAKDGRGRLCETDDTLTTRSKVRELRRTGMIWREGKDTDREIEGV